MIVPGGGPFGGRAGPLGKAMSGLPLKKARVRRIVASGSGMTALEIVHAGDVGRRKSAGDAS